MPLIRFIFLLISFFSCFSISGQSNPVDSFRQVLQNQPPDTNKVKTLWRFCDYLLSRNGNSVEALKYAQESLTLSKKLGVEKYIAWSYVCLSSAYYADNDYFALLNYTDSALTIFRRLGNIKGISECLHTMGFSSFDTGDTIKANRYYGHVLQLAKENKDTLLIIKTYNSLGEICNSRGRYNEALQNHFAALSFCIEPTFDDAGWGRASSYQYIAKAYDKMADSESMQGNAIMAKKYFDEALKAYNKAYDLFQESNNVIGMAQIKASVGNILLQTGDIREAKKKLLMALKDFHAMSYKEELEQLYFSLSKLFAKEKNYTAAYQYLTLYNTEKERINSGNVIRKLEGLRLKAEMDKKEHHLALLSSVNKLKTALAQKERQKKNFAFVVIGILICSGGYWFYSFKKKKRQQHAESLLKERLRISRELHDDLGATLSGVAMYSMLIKTQIQSSDYSGAEKSLDIVKESSTQMVDRLSDMIWLLKKEQPTMEGFHQKLEDYACNMAAVKNMQVQFTSKMASNYSLTFEQRHNIYLFCKEAINNAVKYSEGNLLQFTINKTGQNIEYIISDNGKGFDPETAKAGNGLKNMRQRAQEIGATMMIRSCTAGGTAISLKTFAL